MKRQILTDLLAKYERSKQARGEGLIRRHIGFNMKDFPEYQENDLTWYKTFRQAALDLAAQKLIEIEWVPYEKGNLIKGVYLIQSKLDEVYRIAGRKPQLDTLGELEETLAGLDLSSPWAIAFVTDCLKEIRDKLRYPSQLPSEQEKLHLLLDTLIGLEKKGNEEMLERIFSKRYLGNSKVFEQQVRRRIVGILRRYSQYSGLEEEDLLTEVGLVRAASEVLISGSLQLRLKEKILNLSPFCYGVGLGNETLTQAEIDKCDWNRVISVENKATFRELLRRGIQEDTLLICLGGFAGPIKRKFLTKIWDAGKESVLYYHWGDLDYGGMQIFNHLKSCWPGLQPLLMNTETYLSYLALGEGYDSQYEEKLKRLLTLDEFNVFHEVLGLMLEKKKTLEQEAVPVNILSTFR